MKKITSTITHTKGRNTISLPLAKRLCIAVALVVVLGSCKKLLDIDPVTSIAAEKFWKSKNDMKTGMAGVYSSIQTMLSSNYIVWGDLRSDNLDIGGNNNYKTQCLGALTATSAGTDWTLVYAAIGNVNTAIKYISTIINRDPSISQVEVNDNLAQLYSLRAYCYFTLIRVWGPVPLWTEPYENINEPPSRARSSVDSVMNLIILPDIQRAFPLFDPNKARMVWYVNSGMTYALLTDVYMWLKKYDKALEASNNLIGKYDLLPKDRWKEIFVAPDQDNSNRAENIWSIYWDWTTDKASGLYNQFSNGSNSTSCAMDIDIYNRWVTERYTDIRFALTTDTNSTTRQKQCKFLPVNLDANKFQVYPKNGQQNTYYCIYRWADIYLLRAEAYANLNDFASAGTIVNAVRVRAGLKPMIFTGTNVSDMLDVILYERQKELFGESKRWYDLVRNGRVPEVMNPILMRRGVPGGWGNDLRKILWPINRTVLNSNKLITPNQPWSD